jgi:hypothetical protein
LGQFGPEFVFPFPCFVIFYKCADICYFHN